VLAAAVLAVEPAPAASKPVAPAARLRAHRTRYYVIYTDLAGDDVREATARMTAMAEEYHRRTRGFAGRIRRRLPFYLFRREEDYRRAGGLPGSAGMYTGERLMAVAQGGTDEQLWHVVQHEGFHQFVHQVIGGAIPVWVNEGLAEYFGQGIWTGDGFVTGLIPPRRLARLQGFLRGGKVLPLADMLRMTTQEWNEALDPNGVDRGADRPRSPARTDYRMPPRDRSARVQYDQAWSMVHFLVHAEGGRHRKAFAGFLRDVSGGAAWNEAFSRRFGRNLAAFEQRYKAWWLGRRPDATWELYARAVVQTMTSFLARASSRGQNFTDAEAFFRAARSGELKSHPTQWLPPRLLNAMLLHARRYRGWSLDQRGKLPKLILRWPDGTVFTGTFERSRGLARDVKVTLTRPTTLRARAEAAAADGAAARAGK
jgi:hypothetical protein